MTFARFMELALYSTGGYYEQQRKIGKAGDFYTSVSVGPFFGELLARQFAIWLDEIDAIELIEIGAHDASLARDILRWFAQNKTEVVRNFIYTIVEPSAQRKAWQQQTLERYRANVRWIDKLSPGVQGAIFSNELLDAMPVHRLRWDAKMRTWMEWLVGCEGERLASVIGELSPQAATCAPAVARELAEVLPDGFTTEVSPTAIRWWTEAARALQRGYLVGIDYGLAEEEFFRLDRMDGTARSYAKHRVSEDLLANPGEQDITAHVNWTAIQRAGEETGLHTDTFCSQEQFIMNIVRLAADENWNAEQIKQLKTLTHPNFLGRAFRVLVQTRH